jgi:hypothetical protein
VAPAPAARARREDLSRSRRSRGRGRGRRPAGARARARPWRARRDPRRGRPRPSDARRPAARAPAPARRRPRDAGDVVARRRAARGLRPAGRDAQPVPRAAGRRPPWPVLAARTVRGGDPVLTPQTVAPAGDRLVTSVVPSRGGVFDGITAILDLRTGALARIAAEDGGFTRPAPGRRTSPRHAATGAARVIVAPRTRDVREAVWTRDGRGLIADVDDVSRAARRATPRRGRDVGMRSRARAAGAERRAGRS